jgi:hypothetical protein
MKLDKLIHNLRSELDKVEETLTTLEQISSSQQPRRMRRPMGERERRQVSTRMKAYWGRRRARVLLEEVNRSRSEWLSATASFDQLMRDLPNAIQTPDGAARIQQAGLIRRAALKKYQAVLARYNDAIKQAAVWPKTLQAADGSGG